MNSPPSHLLFPDQLDGRPLLLWARVHCLLVTMGHVCARLQDTDGLGSWPGVQSGPLASEATFYLFTERIRRLSRELGASQTLDSVLC